MKVYWPVYSKFDVHNAEVTIDDKGDAWAVNDELGQPLGNVNDVRDFDEIEQMPLRVYYTAAEARAALIASLSAKTKFHANKITELTRQIKQQTVLLQEDLINVGNPKTLAASSGQPQVRQDNTDRR